MDFRHVVITPVRNESRFLPKTIESMRRQTVKPEQWIIVDDGSEDDTADIAKTATKNESWIEFVQRGNRGFRLPGKGVVDAFNDGFSRIANGNWQVVSKFDGDLSFDSDYFERCLNEFKNDEKLGIGGGMCCCESGGRRHPEFPFDPPFHVRGPVKMYRRACWEDIGGLKNLAGWDGIDELKANMVGWKSRTFGDILITHHRPTGSADGFWKNQCKFGRANYIMGYHPAFMSAKVLRRMLHRPYLVGSLGLAWGYCGAWVQGVQQVDDPELIRFVRAQQWRTLVGKPSLWRTGIAQ